jgi:hypothetical protein
MNWLWKKNKNKSLTPAIYLSPCIQTDCQSYDENWMVFIKYSFVTRRITMNTCHLCIHFKRFDLYRKIKDK